MGAFRRPASASLILLAAALHCSPKPAVAVPGWASFMSAGEYARFIELVGAELEQRGATFAQQDFVMEISKASSDGRLPAGKYGLANLAQQCKQLPSDQWPDAVAEHFEKAAEATAATSQLDSIAGDYDQIEDKLRVRLYPPEWVEAAGPDQLVSREDLPGLTTVLLFDTPTAVVPVKPGQASKWHLPRDDAFAKGIANSVHDLALDWKEVELAPGMKVTTIAGDEVWHSANVLQLEKLLGPIGELGALVAVPHRQMLIVHKIKDNKHPEFIPPMAKMAEELDREGPGSLSPDLYWYVDHAFVKLPDPRFDQRMMGPRWKIRQEEVPLAPGTLPAGWRAKDSDGYWSPRKDLQMFVSRVDLGVPMDDQPVQQRASMVQELFNKAVGQLGLTTRAVKAPEIQIETTATGFTCAVAKEKNGTQRAFGCVFFEDEPRARWLLVVDVYGYGKTREAGFLHSAGALAERAVRGAKEWAR